MRKKGRPENIYALYKGDELLGIGTKKELANQLGVKISTIQFYHSPAYRARSKINKNRKILVKIEKD